LTVSSTSGIRGIFNSDLLPESLSEYSRNFANLLQADELLLGRDTRSTGQIAARTVTSAVLGTGADVVDYGIISTPAIFRESRRTERPAIIVTASHNEPEWNGLKFVVNGRGINQPELDKVLRKGGGRREGTGSPPSPGSPRRADGFTYNDELVRMVGEGSARGVKVVLDLNGGAAIGHAPSVLRALGCEVHTIGDARGMFTRTIDPTVDPLEVLCYTIRRRGADVGFAFDCDGDRLVVVDNQGRKRSGDFMLTLALKEAFQTLNQRDVVISVDTTQAVDEVVREAGGRVFRAKVGEANVMELMAEKGVRMGGEGSSGGLIDSSFNNCRDSLIAAALIVDALKKRGKRAYSQVRSYHQARARMDMPRKKALEAMKKLLREHPEADTLDGIKLRLSNTSWVLIRASNTEDGVRVSAEASSMKEAERIAQSYVAKVKRAGA
jgi:phosphomannomutase